MSSTSKRRLIPLRLLSITRLHSHIATTQYHAFVLIVLYLLAVTTIVAETISLLTMYEEARKAVEKQE